MKNKHKRKCSKGAVTIFLTLILVPCMIFTCAFGDVSRVALSKSQAAGAADLALYSLMANYDEELKEWYGLVASCQSIDEFYKVSEDYFVGMMSANGLDDTASDTLVAYLDAARNGDFADFLQLEGLDTVSVEPVSGGSLGNNPALIEDGIVEFMKYRGPIVIVENVIDRFKKLSSSGAFKGLREADENEPIMEAKQEYAEAEGEMMNVLLYTYLAIEQYMDYRTASGVPDIHKYQNEYGEKLSKIFDDFKLMTDTITKYYAATEGIENLSLRSGSSSFPQYDLPDTNNLNNTADAILYVRNYYTYTMRGIGAEEKENGVYVLNSAALDENVLHYKDEHIQNIKNAAGRIEAACNGIAVPTSGGDVNDAVYCMLMQKAIDPSDLNIINNDGKALMQMYAKLILAQWCDPAEGESVTQRGQQISNAMRQIEEIHKNYLSYKNPTSNFEKILSQYKKVADVTVKMVTDRMYLFHSEYCGEAVTVGQFLLAVRNEFGTLVTDLDNQIANVNTILNGGIIQYPSGSGKTYTVSSLNVVKQKIIEYSDARDNWGNEAYSHGTSYAKSEQNEYEGVELPSAANESDDVKQARTTSARRSAALYEDGAKATEVLRTRLTNIKNDMQTLKNVLTNCTYGGNPFYELDRNTAIKAVRGVAPTTVDSTRSAYISPFLSKNASAAQGYHQQLIREGTYEPPALDSRENGNDPDLKNSIPALYQYLDEAIEKRNLENAVGEKEAQEKENEENQKKANKEAENSKGFDSGFLNDLGVDPAKTSGSSSFGAITVLTSLVGAVDKIVNGNFDEFRDQLYVCAYIMEMFSYSSYNNEGQYNLSDTPLTYGEHYSKGIKAFKNADLRNRWKEEDVTKFTDNKTLTNRMINSKNNRSNLAEVEYILYGKGTNKANLETSYGNIFAIRETLNLISGFANFYSGTSPTAAAIQGIAATVMATTMGFIPEAITKVVLIGVLATMETARDMQRLKAGTPVVIYKMKEENWTFKLPRDAKSISSIFSGTGLADPEDENGLFYSDYLTLFLMIGAADQNLYSDMLKRIGALIESNMGMKTSGYDLTKAQCYFQLTGDLSVKPLMLKLPMVTNYSGADASGLFEVTDWCSYSLKIVRGYS